MRYPIAFILLVCGAHAAQAQVGMDKHALSLPAGTRPEVHVTTVAERITPDLIEALQHDPARQKSTTTAPSVMADTSSAPGSEQYVSTEAHRPDGNAPSIAPKTAAPVDELPPGRTGTLILAPTIGARRITTPASE